MFKKLMDDDHHGKAHTKVNELVAAICCTVIIQNETECCCCCSETSVNHLVTLLQCARHV
jgi:hypothetical protein